MKAGFILAALAAAGAGIYLYEKNSNDSGAGLFDPVNAMAHAIAVAEGFYVAGSRPQRNHNPGDMTADLIGKGIGRDGPFIIYSTDVDGWNNLRAQIQAWMDGSSANADSSFSIADISRFYTNTQQDSWAANVANDLGVSVDTPLSQIGS